MNAGDVEMTVPPTTDDRRGTGGMILLIATEASLFVMLLFAYFYLAREQRPWPMDAPPRLPLALGMTGVLLTSSFVVHVASLLCRRGWRTAARIALAFTIVLGVAFLAGQVMEYRDHLRTLKPTTDAYGSIFYTITSVHGLHVVVGLAMLAYVLFLPGFDGTGEPPHRPLHNASLYWHFVDVVWLFIVGLLYVLPHYMSGGAL
ncbi:MAG TPA: cytochrome c oxidase subunit 3 [Polyangiaceae bacterium]|nr:cytochrome c oxidase subunit 3 [Polyangiaceae bacterium]